MNRTTLQALEESIAHWERLIAGTQAIDEVPNAKHCPLCKLFNTPDHSATTQCEGCPVFEKVNDFFCEGTPYLQAYDDWCDYGVSSKEFKKSAKKELRFLKSLLPKPKKKNESTNTTRRV